MKKLVLVIAVLALITPISVNAFSISNLWNKVFKKAETSEEKFEYEKLDQILVDEKYDNWLKAFEEKDVYQITGEEYNLLFSNAEINYIFNKRLDELKDPAVDEVELWFRDGNYIEIKANLVKYLPGKISGKIKFKQKGRKLFPQASNIRWNKIPIPSFIINMLMDAELIDLINFMHSYPDYPYISVEIEEDYCELSFKNKIEK